jgi:hypothetical protein
MNHVSHCDQFNPVTGIFSQCSQLPSDYKEREAALCRHYRPIEIDPNLSREEKAKHMVDWYQAVEKLLTGFEFQTKELEEVIKNGGVELRYLCLYQYHAVSQSVLTRFS